MVNFISKCTVQRWERSLLLLIQIFIWRSGSGLSSSNVINYQLPIIYTWDTWMIFLGFGPIQRHILKNLRTSWTHTMSQFQFNIIYKKEQIEFLDTQIFFNQDVTKWPLGTRVFFKPTDTHALVHRTRFHPRYTFHGIVKSQYNFTEYAAGRRTLREPLEPFLQYFKNEVIVAHYYVTLKEKPKKYSVRGRD